METILQLVVIVILTVFEGVFVAAEIALVTIRRTRDRAARRGGEPVGEAGQGPDRAARPLPGRHPDRPDLPRLPRLGVCRRQPDGQPRARVRGERPADPVSTSAGALALIIVTLLLSLFTIVFGELVPKSLALAHTEQFALRLSGFIVVLLGALGPLVQRPDGDHDGRVADARRGRPCPGRDDHAGAVDPGRARRRAGDPRGRRGADDPGGHRARRPAHPRGHGPAHRDGHAGPPDRRWRMRSTSSSRRATAGSRSTRTRSTRSSGSCMRRTSCRSSRRRPPSGRRSGPCSGRPSSCPSR